MWNEVYDVENPYPGPMRKSRPFCETFASTNASR